MTDTLYAFPAANNGLALYRDEEQREHVATYFRADDVGEYVTFSDGWQATNYRVVRIDAQLARAFGNPLEGK